MYTYWSHYHVTNNKMLSSLVTIVRHDVTLTPDRTV